MRGRKREGDGEGRRDVRGGEAEWRRGGGVEKGEMKYERVRLTALRSVR